jgi:hypothetical protein
METVLIRMKDRRESKQTFFFEFSQNNSGGHWDVNDKLTHRLYIESHSEKEATRFAEDLGVYFNGCEDGMDCECCGDRWYGCTQLEVPHVYGLFTLDEANELASTYECEIRPAIKWKPSGKRTHEVLFQNVESYVKFMVDKWGYDFKDKPDSRIFYLNGDVLEVFGKRK